MEKDSQENACIYERVLAICITHYTPDLTTLAGLYHRIHFRNIWHRSACDFQSQARWEEGQLGTIQAASYWEPSSTYTGQ